VSTEQLSAPDDAAVNAYVTAMIAAAAELTFPDLLDPPAGSALYHRRDRNGVTTVVLPASALSEPQLIGLMKYRLAQYVAINFVDARMIYDAQMQYEPLSRISPHDIHVLALSEATGEILCYATIEAAPDAPARTTLRDEERPLFPVEAVHGWGIFNRLRVLPDLPFGKIRELGRFVKNQRLSMLDELGARGPVEVGVALFRLLAGDLRLEVEAIIGDLEEGVARQNLEFFHVPMVVLHGTVPYESETSYFFPRYQFCTVYPFATLSVDVSRQMISRLDAIEAALEQPGKRGLLALFALKRDIAHPTSNLEPPGGLAELIDTNVPEQGGAMPLRREMLDLAGKLRETDLFSGLSVGEAAVLGTFMERVETEPGEVIIHQGDTSDCLFLIESGSVEVQTFSRAGEKISLATLGAGDFVGEIALLTGAPRTADVIVSQPAALLKLTKDAYARYLGHAAEVEQRMTQAALGRSVDTARKAAAGEP
jgi:hypothetical protein